MFFDSSGTITSLAALARAVSSFEGFLLAEQPDRKITSVATAKLSPILAIRLRSDPIASLKPPNFLVFSFTWLFQCIWDGKQSMRRRSSATPNGNVCEISTDRD